MITDLQYPLTVGIRYKDHNRLCHFRHPVAHIVTVPDFLEDDVIKAMIKKYAKMDRDLTENECYHLLMWSVAYINRKIEDPNYEVTIKNN